MWESARRKLERLRRLDQTCQVFGADKHEYELPPPVPAARIDTLEERIGGDLPQSVRRFYTEMGNGGAGPHFGLLPVEQVAGHRPNEPYPGIDVIKREAEAEGTPVDEAGYFEAPNDSLRGLLRVCWRGCGHQTCVVVRGEARGTIVEVSAAGYVEETGQGFRGYYEHWLDRHLDALQRTKALIEDGYSIHEIDEIVTEELSRPDGKDLVVSLIGAEKPDSLFGGSNTMIFDSATQNPWYEEQLARYRAKHGQASEDRGE